MGESFLGLPNRFKIINDLLESTYNPNHMLSAYQGYRLSKDYVNRNGGKDFAMGGPLVTVHVYPKDTASWDIGTPSLKYQNIYATNVHGNVSGNADTATKLQTTRIITLTGSVTGSAKTDLGGDVTISTTTNHNHDSLYLKKTGGSITGSVFVDGSIYPVNSGHSLGTLTQKWDSIYAKTISADTFIGSSSTATKLSNARTVTVMLSPTTESSNNSGSAAFDGSADVKITVPAPYLPITGGTLSGELYTRTILPTENASYGNYGTISGSDLGSGDKQYRSVYALNVYAKLQGTANDAIKLKNSRAIKVTLTNSISPSSNSGSSSFDGSSDVEISVSAPYLPITGGTLSGSILPEKTDTYYLGSNTNQFKCAYVNTAYVTTVSATKVAATDSMIAPSFVGNADTTTKLQTARTITVGKTSRKFDGSSDISWSLADIGAADASVVGTATSFKSQEYSFSSGNSDELGDLGTQEFYGDSNVAHTVEAGTYIVIARLVGSFLPRVLEVGIATGSSSDSVSLINSSIVHVPSCPVVVSSDGTTIKARTNAFQHNIESVSIQTFTTTTTIVPWASITFSPNWGGNLLYYKLSLRCVRIK